MIGMTWTAQLGGMTKSFDSQFFRAKLRGEGSLALNKRENLVPHCYSGPVRNSDGTALQQTALH